MTVCPRAGSSRTSGQVAARTTEVEMIDTSMSGTSGDGTRETESEPDLELASRQADELRDDEEDLAEMVAVAKEMDSLRAW
jgi:hypothetical protein